MPDDEAKPTPAELAGSITGADRPSQPYPERLRAQWNVPRGVKPHIPLWFTLVFLGLFAFMIASSLLNR